MDEIIIDKRVFKQISVNHNYYIDCDGNTYLVNDTSSPYYEKMQEYWNLIYYNMFDNK